MRVIKTDINVLEHKAQIMRYALLVLAIVFIVAYMAWPDKASTVTVDSQNIVHYHFDNINIELAKGEDVDSVFMIHGFQTKPNMVGDGFLATIPIAAAKLLMAKYPEMNQCNGEGSEFAKQAVIETMFMYDTNALALPTKAKHLEDIYHSSRTPICLRLKGTALLQREMKDDNGRQIEMALGNTRFLYLSDMDQVDCDISK